MEKTGKMIKRADIFYPILCAMAIVGFLIFAPKLPSFSTTLSYLMIALIVLGGTAIFLIARLIWRLDVVLPKYQEAYKTLDKILKSPGSQTLLKKALEENNRIRAENPDSEILEILCRERFFRIVRTWNKPDSITTFHSLESLRALSSEWLMKEFVDPIEKKFFTKTAITRLTEKNYDPVRSNWYANSEDKEPSFETSYAIFRTLQSYFQEKGEESNFENFSHILGRERIERFEESLREYFDISTGGFRDIDESEPSISSTGLAIRIISVLHDSGNSVRGSTVADKMRSMFGFRESATPWEFIMQCYKEIEIDGKEAAGFRQRLGGENIYTCVNYFAASALNFLGRTKELDSLRKNRLIIAYLDASLKPSSTTDNALGYSAFPKVRNPDLIHTYYALRFAEIACPEYLNGKKEAFFTQIANFIASCKSGFGYGFKENWAPNVYATCVARNLTMLAKRYMKKPNTGFDPIESLIFFISCYNGKESKFAGYPFEKPTAD